MDLAVLQAAFLTLRVERCLDRGELGLGGDELGRLSVELLPVALDDGILGVLGVMRTHQALVAAEELVLDIVHWLAGERVSLRPMSVLDIREALVMAGDNSTWSPRVLFVPTLPGPRTCLSSCSSQTEV